MTNILTELHGSKIGLSENNEVILQNPTSGINEVVLRPSGLNSAATYTTTSGLTGKYAKLSEDTLLLTLANVTFALTDEAGVVAYGSVKIADLPVTTGYWLVGASADLTITKSSAGVNDDWDSDIAIGTAAASNNATLTATEANILASTAVPQASSGTTRIAAYSAKSIFTASSVPVQTAQSIYINFVVDDADHNVTGTACNIILNGTVALNITEVLASNY